MVARGDILQDRTATVLDYGSRALMESALHHFVKADYRTRTMAKLPDTVRGTRIGVHTNAEILARKLVYRILGEAAFLSRDLYDLAVARHQDPAALKTAFDTVHPPNLFVIQRGLSELDQVSVVRDSRPLLHPAHPGEAADFLAIVQRLVEREIDRRNPPTPPHHISPSRTG